MANGDKLATVRLGPPESARMIAWQLRGAGDALVGSRRDVRRPQRDDQGVRRFRRVLRANRGNIDAVIELLRK